MASAAELSFLLFALINNIHAEELITIRREMDSHTFRVPKEANFCLISRFVGEEKLVLWNTSALWSQNSTVPEDLKPRLSVVSRDNISSYMIQSLTHSDSGQYQEECWTEGNVTYEKNISITICSRIDRIKVTYVKLRGQVDLPCRGAADSLDVQWLKTEFGYEQNIWTRVLEDSATAAMDNVTGGPQVVKTTSGLHLSNIIDIFNVYTCLVMNQEQCNSSHPEQLSIRTTVVYHSVKETAVLQCTVSDFSDDQPPLWMKDLKPYTNKKVLGRNHSLVISSLMLNHTGTYTCKTSINEQRYLLLVCPEFDPPAVELFSEGDEVALGCKDREGGVLRSWFIKSNQTEDRIVNEYDLMPDLKNRMDISATSLVISNVTMGDRGEYWCAVFDRDLQCLATTKTLVKHREPPQTDFTLYTVRCSLLSGLLVVLCVVVVAVNQRTRRGEQHSAETDR